jgi:hypothetical protein
MICARCKKNEATRVYKCLATPQTEGICEMCFHYEKNRNKLIPRAVKYADKRNGEMCFKKRAEKREAWCIAWNLDYHKKMAELVAK